MGTGYTRKNNHVIGGLGFCQLHGKWLLQLCLCNEAPVKTKEINVQVSKWVGNTSCIFSHIDGRRVTNVSFLRTWDLFIWTPLDFTLCVFSFASSNLHPVIISIALYSTFLSSLICSSELLYMRVTIETFEFIASWYELGWSWITPNLEMVS